jgi:hypothetical protein
LVTPDAIACITRHSLSHFPRNPNLCIPGMPAATCGAARATPCRALWHRAQPHFNYLQEHNLQEHKTLLLRIRQRLICATGRHCGTLATYPIFTRTSMSGMSAAWSPGPIARRCRPLRPSWHSRASGEQLRRVSWPRAGSNLCQPSQKGALAPEV